MCVIQCGDYSSHSLSLTILNSTWDEPRFSSGTLYWPAIEYSKDQLYEMMKGYKIFKRK
jgi:hypothetical protein